MPQLTSNPGVNYRHLLLPQREAYSEETNLSAAAI